MQPGLIRVDADELTYGLHVVVRFELEQEMLTGAVRLDELPEAWNARMKAYLGVDVPDAARGVLQDVHWSLGLVGYFPTYVIGSIVSAQIWESCWPRFPICRSRLNAASSAACANGCATTCTATGASSRRRETLQKVTGTDTVDVGPYVAYLRRKFGEIYNLPA